MQALTVERVLGPGDTEGGEEAGGGCQSTPGQGKGFMHRAETRGHSAFRALDYTCLESQRACLAQAYGTFSKWRKEVYRSFSSCPRHVPHPQG